MTYKIALQLEDYLTYQLYAVSKSERVLKKKKRSWIIFPVFLCIMGFVILFLAEKGNAYFYFILALIWAVGYPFYFRWAYKKHFKRYVKEGYGKKVGLPIEIEIGKDFLFSKDEDTEAKIKINQFNSFIELNHHLFLSTKTGDTLIIPKAMEQFDSFEKELKERADKYKVEWIDETLWAW